MILHKILRGDGAELYLPFGLARLRALVQIYGEGFFEEKYEVGGALVEVQQSPPFQYVRVTGAQAYFEFLTSGKPVETRTTVDSVSSFTQYKAAAVGVTTSITSTVARIANGAKSYNVIPNSPLGRPAQIDLISEPVGYIETDKTLLYQSYAPVSPHTGPWLRSFIDLDSYSNWYDESGRNPRFERGSTTAFTLRDIDFDVPFQYGVGKTPATRAYIRGDADWPRANAIYQATDDTWGSRTFGIYADAFGQFWFFPISEITAELPNYGQNVPDDVVKMVKPILPSWAWVSSGTAMDWWTTVGVDAAVDFPDIQWRFSADGTKACAVVFERRPAVFDHAYYYANPSTNAPTDATFAEYNAKHTGPMGKFNSTFALGHNDARYSIAPGLVQIEFVVTLTGANSHDFAMSAIVTEIRRPTTCPYFTALADYCWHDIKAADWTSENQHYDAKAGDLIVLDLERYYVPTMVGSFLAPPTARFFALKNISVDRNARLQNFPGSYYGPTTAETQKMFFSNGAQVAAADLRTLSVAMRVGSGAQQLKTVPRLSDPTATVQEAWEYVWFGIRIYTMNRYRTTLYPDTLVPSMLADLKAREGLTGADTLAASPRVTTFVALNLMGTYSAYRDWAIGPWAKSPPPSVVTPSDADQALFNGAFGFSAGTAPGGVSWPRAFLLTDPCFSWNAYGADFCQDWNVTGMSTFFAHPNGTWAFYDQQYVFNGNGVPNPSLDNDINPFDANSYDPVDVGLFEHVIFDAVHLVTSASQRDTTFLDLYNSAVSGGTALGTLVDNFQPMTKADLRATFTKIPYEVTGPWYTTWPAPFTTAIIGVTWGGLTGYYFEGLYVKAPGKTFIRFGGVGDQMGTLSWSLGDLFYTDFTFTTNVSMLENASPIKFSSPVMVV